MGKSKKRKKKNITKNVYKEPSITTLENQKTDYDIPSFSLKGSLIVMVGAVIGNIVLPMILSLFGISQKLGIIIGNVTVTAYTISFVRYFIESKKGYCKEFLINYSLFAVGFGVISFFWVYLNTYI